MKIKFLYKGPNKKKVANVLIGCLNIDEQRAQEIATATTATTIVIQEDVIAITAKYLRLRELFAKNKITIHLTLE